MPIPKTSSEITDDIAARIRRGEWPPGTQLPSYAALAAEYGVHVSTIARIIAALRERGQVVGVPGRGTFVAET